MSPGHTTARSGICNNRSLYRGNFMIDLISIARAEADGGELSSIFDGMFEKSSIKPDGYPDAVVWQGGNFDAGVQPVVTP